MPPSYFPLRWESAGDQWWFASPIDWAAANGHYDVVRELLNIDNNLLTKLTSLPRIRRLESVWDDDENFSNATKCRAQVALKLLQECETKKGHNSLIRAGHGGWLLYTAASAGDLVFVKELLEREPFLVFGEGEYGVTEMFYAAARGKNCEVFRVLLDCAASPRSQANEILTSFQMDMMNRAVHAAARGGNVEMLKELLSGNGDVLEYRDAYGSNVLHSAAGEGQVEVVKYLINSYNVVNSRDNQGNLALHVAAYRGHLAIVKALIMASPPLVSLTNYHGDTFLHMAASGFSAPGFRTMDRRRSLLQQLVTGMFTNVEDIINVQNKDGRTTLHLAVIDNIQLDIVKLLMSVQGIDLNIRDADGNTPLDLLKQRPQTPSSEILIKRLISAGGVSDCREHMALKAAIVSHVKTCHGIGSDPGTSFAIPDGEIFLHTRTEDQHTGRCSSDSTSIECSYSGKIVHARLTTETSTPKYKKFSSMNSTVRRLKNIFRCPGKDTNTDTSHVDDHCSSVVSFRTSSGSGNGLVSLRQQFSRASSLPGNKRVSSFPQNLPSRPAKKKFAGGLSHDVLKVQHLQGSPSSAFSDSTLSSPKENGSATEPSAVDQWKMKKSRHGSLNLRVMDNLCFGKHGLSVEKSIISTSGRRNQANI